MGKYREYSYEEYKEAMEIMRKGTGIAEASRKLNIPKSTLYFWKHGTKPPTARWMASPSKELSYVLGVLYGDGFLVKKYSYHYDLELIVKDYEFSLTFSKAVAKILNKRLKPPKWHRRLNTWRVRYYPKAFYKWFKEQSKEHSLDTLIEHDKDTVKYFLRGLYDSEGSNYKSKKILLYNSDQELLKYTQYLLKKYFNIRATGPYLYVRAGSISRNGDGEEVKRNYNVYYTEISRKGDVQIFLSEIGFSIREKQLGLKRT